MTCLWIGAIHVMTVQGQPSQRGKERIPMPTFTIDTDNNVTVYTTLDEATRADTSLPRFSSPAELGKLATEWPASRLIEIWNSIPGNSKLTRLGPRAAARIWKALQPLAAVDSEAAKPAKGRKSATGTKAAKGTKSARAKVARGSRKVGTPPKKLQKATTKGGPRRASKKAEIIALMQRAKGASLLEIQGLAGWQKHSVRGFISILGSKGGLKIKSEKNAAGDRFYRIAK